MEQVMTWAGPALDGGLIVLLGLVLWRLGHDPTAAWREREEALREISGGLRTTVAQAEGLARDLDARLADHHTQLSALLRTAAKVRQEAETRSSAAVARDGRDRDDGETLDGGKHASRGGAGGEEDAIVRARRLVAAGLDVNEIARRLDLPPAEARVLMSLASPLARHPARTAGRLPGSGAGRPAHGSVQGGRQ